MEPKPEKKEPEKKDSGNGLDFCPYCRHMVLTRVEGFRRWCTRCDSRVD